MERIDYLLKHAPALRKESVRKINNIFPSYLFISRGRGELWTTCCGRHELVYDKRTSSREERAIFDLPHIKEPRPWETYNRHNTTACPYCGKRGTVKELRYTGRRENLYAFDRVAVFRWHEGALWCELLNVEKSYTDVDKLCAMPTIHSYGYYRFEPGRAEQATRTYDWWTRRFGQYHYNEQSEPLKGGKWNIDTPLSYTKEYGKSYDVIGIDELKKSPFRYCFVDNKPTARSGMLKYITACCIYPRQIEMLVKGGYDWLVDDLVYNGVKNQFFIRWDKEKPSEAFTLTKLELRELSDVCKRIDFSALQVAQIYLRLKKKGITESFQTVKIIYDNQDAKSEIEMCLARGISLRRFANYFNADRLHSTWVDYIRMAGDLDYDLDNETVFLPRDLKRAHDNAVEEYNAKKQRINAEKERELREKMQKSFERRRKEYNFELGDYFIRIAESAEEIRQEGKALVHCVGGYAERHVQDRLTILFLRKKEAPDESLYTVEMQGDKLVQIHGYKNEGMYSSTGRFAPDPAVTMEWFLTPWLEWIKNGSKRDKDGNPIIKQKKARKTA